MIFVSSSCIKNEYISDTVEQLAKAGIKNIELSGGTKYYDSIKEDLLSFKNEYKLNYVCHSYFPPPERDFVVNLASSNDDILDMSLNHYYRCIELLTELDIKTLSIHAGMFIDFTPESLGKKITSDSVYEEEESYKIFIESYNDILSRCRERGIELYLENHVFTKENYDQYNRNILMMTDIDSINCMKQLLDFNLLLDIGHFNVSCSTLGKDFKEDFSKLVSVAEWYHLSDNDGIKDQHKPFLNENSNLISFAREAIRSGKNVTLETIGSIDDIKTSIELLSM